MKFARPRREGVQHLIPSRDLGCCFLFNSFQLLAPRVCIYIGLLIGWRVSHCVQQHRTPDHMLHLALRPCVVSHVASAFQPIPCTSDADCSGDTCGVHPQRWADGSYKGGVEQGSCGTHIAWVSGFSHVCERFTWCCPHRSRWFVALFVFGQPNLTPISSQCTRQSLRP